MLRRDVIRACGAGSLIALAGCAGPFDDPDPGRLDLTVQNDRAGPVDAQVEVVDEEGRRTRTRPIGSTPASLAPSRSPSGRRGATR